MRASSTSVRLQYPKRIFDLFLALLMFILMSPLLLVLALAIRVLMGSPVVFRQKRPGLSGRPFTIFKFRTMTDARDSQGTLLPDSERLTPLGRFLRSTSLDELPEIFNVIRGDMSLVGPRPLRMEYLKLYTPEQARRHDVRPGITGWAQINGRNELTWEERFELDTWYVDNVSFWLDVKILLLTIPSVVSRRGISAKGHATMYKFAGSQGSDSGIGGQHSDSRRS